jgi:23S rRNA (adenine2503-C2)-methyltransferase
MATLDSDARASSFFDPRDSSPNEILARFGEAGMNERNVRRLLGRIVGLGDYSPQSWFANSIISSTTLRTFSNAAQTLPSLETQQISASAKDGFRKILFRTADNLSIETVLIPLHKAGKLTVCLSSQVGCVMGCTFCATAKMTQRRSLKTWEIVDQLVQARKVAHENGESISGIVFMGMGEPFLNYSRVIAAAELLSFPVLNAISAKAITISTVGVLDKIKLFTSERHPFRLSISLGAATDEKRARLVPVAAKTPIKLILQAAKEHAAATRQRIMLSYVCIGGENMFEEDAQALGELIQDTPVRLDLIEVNDSSGRYRTPTSDEFNVFRDALSKHVKHPIVRRYSGGADIQAACGTLAGRDFVAETML